LIYFAKVKTSIWALTETLIVFIVIVVAIVVVVSFVVSVTVDDVVIYNQSKPKESCTKVSNLTVIKS